MPRTVPCQSCIGCRADKAYEWAIRCTHEAQLHQENCFVTLTYSDEFLPSDGSLSVLQMQHFMRRLRKKYAPKKIRFYLAGEYGGENDRPHYHLLLFGLDFPDKQLWSKNPQGNCLYTSEALTLLWGQGELEQQLIGELNFNTAGYVARYTLKKMEFNNWKMDCEKNEFVLKKSGLIVRAPFASMSLKYGIGEAWFNRFYKDVYPHDNIVIKGKKMPVPVYYDKLLEKRDPKLFLKIKRQRKANMKKRAADNTPERLAVREEIKYSKMDTLKRNL